MAAAAPAPTVSEDSPSAVPSWLPLESNPEVLNPFCKRLGLPDGWGFTDVWGLDDELLMMLPQPCVALCLLYPSTDISGPRREEIRTKVAAEAPPAPPAELFFLQQHDGIGNACGTIASIHAIASGVAAGHYALESGSPLGAFMGSTSGLGIADRGWELTKATALQELSDATAAAGQTEGAGTDDAQNQHFICFTCLGGTLYELDGRCFGSDGVAMPVNHGPSTPESFLGDAAKVIKEDFMTRTQSVNFNITALCKLD